jgi:hypothetical protein
MVRHLARAIAQIPFFAAVRSAATRGTCASRSAAVTRRTIGSSASAFEWPRTWTCERSEHFLLIALQALRARFAGIASLYRYNS